MKLLRRQVAALGLMAVLLHASIAGTVPLVGQHFPVFDVPDLTGRVHSTTELTGRRTLVVAITEMAGSDPMGVWGEIADRHIGHSIHRVWMVLFNLAFIVPTGTVRSTARGRTPEGAWADTWLDVHNDRYIAAGLPGSPMPWAFALDETGTVIAAFHGAATDPGAEAIWRALRRPAPTAPPP